MEFSVQDQGTQTSPLKAASSPCSEQENTITATPRRRRISAGNPGLFSDSGFGQKTKTFGNGSRRKQLSCKGRQELTKKVAVRSIFRPSSRGSIDSLLGSKAVKSKAIESPLCSTTKPGSIAKAIEIAANQDMDKSVAKLKEQFFAASSARSRASKRNEIAKLCLTITKGRAFVPVSAPLVEAVAASLKQAGLK